MYYYKLFFDNVSEIHIIVTNQKVANKLFGF